MNNKYLSGLLVGVLTAGVLQGSDGKENMPGLGGNQTQRQNKSSQAENNAGITEELKAAASELAASYDERAEGSQNERKKEEFRAKAEALRKEFEVENVEKFLDAKDMVEVKEIRYRYVSELAEYYKQRGNNRFVRDLLNDFAYLDHYASFIVSQKFENNDDFRNFQLSKTRFGYETHINNAPIRNADDAKLYPKLQTQQIFGQEDYIVPGMYQYIITYPVTKKEIEAWVAQLLPNIHHDVRINSAEKPIVVNLQGLTMDEVNLCGYSWTVKRNLDLGSIAQHSVEIKKRKCFGKVNFGGWNNCLLDCIVKALVANNVIFEKIILLGSTCSIKENFKALKEKMYVK